MLLHMMCDNKQTKYYILVSMEFMSSFINILELLQIELTIEWNESHDFQTGFIKYSMKKRKDGIFFFFFKAT